MTSTKLNKKIDRYLNYKARYESVAMIFKAKTIFKTLKQNTYSLQILLFFYFPRYILTR